ncbi:hypothetical protein SeMB42_g02974 [Synchytrium endobioticum]|uniref:Signal recognition particle, SRP19 subunit n=1 Tax=Synchytrium endobioticum TaxID=286115 RepID=A0A507DC18_9FUNG|nr:hypothetical protein SeMB42_g02974 [Synchytrium endobioticum]TPX49036.1 hypothetical protein SeLEV6574_g01714 [Synchytrium endobioticum]
MSEGKGKGIAVIDDADDRDIDEMEYELPSVSYQESTSTAQVAPPPQSTTIPSKSMPMPHLGQSHIDSAQLQKFKSWICCYPIYIDADKSVQEGRRIPKPLAVKEPNIFAMVEAVRRLGLSAVLEGDKRHPRDPLVFGRLRVQLRAPDGQSCHPAISTKRQLLCEVSKLVPEMITLIKQTDPRVAAMMASSRSGLINIIREEMKASVKEIEERSGTVKPGKVSKKKKGK